jgi:hypothetical protein
LDKLKETTAITKHVALAINEELDILTTLILGVKGVWDGETPELQPFVGNKILFPL